MARYQPTKYQKEQAESRREEATLAALLQSELQGLIEKYEELKARSGKLDFADLLIRVRNLIRENADVRRFMQDQFTHIFVDEFQDTDPVQVEILVLLAADDPNQNDWRAVRPKQLRLRRCQRSADAKEECAEQNYRVKHCCVDHATLRA